MSDSSSLILVGLEVGTSKVCAVVGELNAEGGLSIIGLVKFGSFQQEPLRQKATLGSRLRATLSRLLTHYPPQFGLCTPLGRLKLPP